MILHYRTAEGRELNGVAAPLRFDGARSPLRAPPPRLGQDSAALLDELGYSAESLEAFVRRGSRLRLSVSDLLRLENSLIAG